jgi:hypothetical protein
MRAKTPEGVRVRGRSGLMFHIKPLPRDGLAAVPR